MALSVMCVKVVLVYCQVRREATASLQSAAQAEVCVQPVHETIECIQRGKTCQLTKCVYEQEGEDMLEGGEGDLSKEDEGKEGEEDTTALFGSHGPKYGGGCDLLYTQFELHSPVAKKHQIVLLQV